MTTRTTPSLTLGELLVKSRRAKGIRSQEAMAKRLGVSRNTVVRWETNEETPRRGMLIAWAAITGAEWVLPEDVTVDVRFDESGCFAFMGLTAHPEVVTLGEREVAVLREDELVGCR